MTYKVRTYEVGAMGFLTQADHFHDFMFESLETLEEIARRLSATGFRHPGKNRWIMPSAIIWVEEA